MKTGIAMRMSMKWWVLPILLGVPAGVLTGVYLCWNTPACLLYAGSHLHRLLALALMQTVDRYALIFAGIFVALLLGVLAANRCHGACKVLLLIFLPLGMLGWAGKLFLPAPAWSSLLRVLANPSVLVYAVLAVGLGIFVWLEYRILRSRRPPGTAPAAAKRWLQPVGRIGRAALFCISGVFLLLLLGINLAAGVLWAHAAITVRSRPNVILVMVCSLRADHLGCYGYDLDTTPNLDRFARESTRFAQAVAPSSWTLWSTASILTSRYPERIFNDRDILTKYSLYPGLPPALANLGYATCAVSDHPFFQEHLENSYDFRQGFDDFVLLGDDFDVKAAPSVTAIALQHVGQLKGRRFFQLLMYADPHAPYTRHPAYRFGPSAKDALGPQWKSSLASPFQQQEWEKLQGLLTNAGRHITWGGEPRQDLLAKYNSEIAFTDRAIGDLFAGLQQLGLYDDALIIVCGDHGEEFLEHGSYGHMATLYREVTDVPLLIKFPRQREGKVIGGRFPLIDLYPSIMALVRGDGAHLGMQGDRVDLPALLRCTDKPIYGATVRDVRSVISGQYKYYQAAAYRRTGGNPVIEGRAFMPSQAPDQLFDLQEDPGEFLNRMAVLPERGSSLRDALHAHDAYLKRTDIMYGSPQAVSSAREAQVRQRLRALGYLQE